MKYEIKTQLSVEIENTPGKIAELSDILTMHDVSLSALSIQDGPANGRFRFTVCDPVAAKRSLEKNGFRVFTEEVLAIRTKDSKGRLALLTKALSQAGINIDYMYASVDEEGAGSRMILKVSNIHLAAHVIDEIKIAA